MGKIFNLKNTELSLKDFLYKKLESRRDIYLQKIAVKYADDKLKLFDAQQQIESDFNNDLKKLDIVDDALKDDKKKQRKYVEMMKYMDDYEEINILKENLLDGILSYGILLGEMPNLITSISFEDAYLIVSSLASLDDLSVYNIYTKVIANPALLNVLREKTSDINEKRNMIDEMFEYLYDIDYDDYNNDEYLNAVRKCIIIVNNYKLKSVQKER